MGIFVLVCLVTDCTAVAAAAYGSYTFSGRRKEWGKDWGFVMPRVPVNTHFDTKHCETLCVCVGGVGAIRKPKLLSLPPPMLLSLRWTPTRTRLVRLLARPVALPPKV